METVTNLTEVEENVYQFHSYASSNNPVLVDFHRSLLALGKIFVVLRADKNLLFCPSRFAGYQRNNYVKHMAFPFKDGKVTTPVIDRLLGKKHEQNKKLESAYLKWCASIGARPSKKVRSYWSAEASSMFFGEAPVDDDLNAFYPDDADVKKTYQEGMVKTVLVNAFERNREAREACVAHYGAKCSVCKFDFEKRFGFIGVGFIHVHHLLPLSSVGHGYEVDPVKDLRPVCPNCHAMLHRSSPPLSIEELREIVSERKRIKA